MIKYIILFLLTIQVKGQESDFQKDIELGVGVQVMGFKFNDNKEYFSRTRKNTEAIVNFYIHLSYLRHHKTDDNLFYKIGLGISRELISGEPILPIIQTGISEDSSLTIVEIAHVEYHLKIPLNLSYALPRFRNGYGFQLSIGLEPRIRIIYVDTRNFISNNYNYEDHNGELYVNETIDRATNDYYSEMINPFSLVSTVGGGLKMPKTGASVGYKINYMIIDPFKKSIKGTSKFGFSFFGIIPLFNIK